MVSMKIVKTSLDNMDDSTVRFAHLPVGNMAMLSNSNKLSSASSCASTHAVQICSQRECMLAAASRKRRRCEPAIQPRQSACYSLQAPGLPMSHSLASGLRQGRHRPCQGTTKNLICCCTVFGSPEKTGFRVCERVQTMKKAMVHCIVLMQLYCCAALCLCCLRSCSPALQDHQSSCWQPCKHTCHGLYFAWRNH